MDGKKGRENIIGSSTRETFSINTIKSSMIACCVIEEGLKLVKFSLRNNFANKFAISPGSLH
jgi:hypothetical protein